MIIKIDSIQITPNPVQVGNNFKISVDAHEVTWSDIKKDFSNWNDIKKLKNWNSLKTYGGE